MSQDSSASMAPEDWSEKSSSTPKISHATVASPLDKPFLALARVHAACLARELQLDDTGAVHWKPKSKSHPRNWGLTRKIYDTAIISFLEFFMTAVSNTGSALIVMVAKDTGISRELALLAYTTSYLLAQGVGGLVFSPIAESFGGRRLYTASTLVFAVFCLGIALSPTLSMLIVGRIITGLMSAMAPIVGCGTIENLWDMASRSFVIHWLIACSIFGLAVGPTLGTFFATSQLGWHWLFYFGAIIAGFVTLLCVSMRESRPSSVLRAHVKAIGEETGFRGLRTDVANSPPTLRMFIRTSLLLPARLLLTEPIVMLVSLMIGFVGATIYLFSEALDAVYLDGFGFSARQNSSVTLALAVGVALSWMNRIGDLRLRTIRRRQGKRLEPEDKLFGFYVAAPVLAVGLWWFSATVPPGVREISPWASIASLVLVGFSTVEFAHVLNAYLCDAYGMYAASATAAMSFLRCALCGTFPLFSNQFFETLGANEACFVLAALATVFVAVAAYFGRYGRRIREASPLAREAWLASSSVEHIIQLTSSVGG